jgi:hypothetical protein
MRDLVDGLRVGIARMMPYTECEVAEGEPLAIANKAEDHPELAIWDGQVHLETGWQLRAVAALGIAAPQSLDLDAISFKPSASLSQRLRSGTTASHRVLGEGALVEEDAGMTPPDGQGLPLAVCGLKRPVLCL